MPIRFQVDPDFYDHPKTIGLSDAAVALWTRAGSYSVAKLLDGFVPVSVLSRLSKTPIDAAAELIRAGLWRKARGGYRFHEWELRNLTRERVEHERKVDRERKKGARQVKASRKGSAQSAQVTPDIVRAESEGNPPGDPPGVPSMSVSVSSKAFVVKKEASDHESNARENGANIFNIQDEPRSKSYPPTVWKIAKAYAAKVNPSNPANVAAHITNATATWDLDLIAKAIDNHATDNRAIGADSLRIELNKLGCDKNGLQRFSDGSTVDWNTGIMRSSGGHIIGGGGYRSGKTMWREA